MINGISDNLWEQIKDIRFFTLDDDDERLSYAIFMASRIEVDLYDTLDRIDAVHMPWEEFHAFICGTPEVQNVERSVLIEAAASFNKNYQFNFTDPNPQLPDDDDSEVFQGYMLLPPEAFCSIVDRMFVGVEYLYYIHQLQSGKTYTWDQYLDAMIADQDMWHRLVLAFREAVMQLDFSPYWEERLDDIIEILDGPVF
mgnify:CR=1 FL=1